MIIIIHIVLEARRRKILKFSFIRFGINFYVASVSVFHLGGTIFGGPVDILLENLSRLRIIAK